MTGSSALLHLRRNLAALGAARRRVRAGAAWSAVGAAAIVGLLAFWALDVAFELSVPQRLLVLTGVAFGLVAVFRKAARPLLGIRESEIELALQVERRQQIDSDLVAALQFEQPAAAQWGSVQLESAVVRYVADVGRKIDVFDGFDNRLLRRRAGWLAATGGLLALLAVLFPGHAAALFHRLLLGARHYPTRTVLERVVVDRQEVLERTLDATSPRPARAPQSHPVRFWLVCSGELPESAQLRLTGETTDAARRIDFVRLTDEERKSRLAAVDRLLERIVAGREPAPSGQKLTETLATLRCDAPEAAAKWPAEAADVDDFRAVRDALGKTLAGWAESVGTTAVYEGELGRLVDSIAYKLYAGDAWTDPATVTMIPLPVVEPRLVVTPPDYARDSAPENAPGARQVSVLEGSRLDVGIACTNGKPLEAAWVSWQTPEGPRSLPMKATDEQKLNWRLPLDDSPFGAVRQEIRFDLQVRDVDGMQLESPVGALVRLRADRPPTASIDVVHRVVLPGARPKIVYRVHDDFGVARIVLHVEMEAGENKRSATAAGDAPEGRSEASVRKQSFELLPEGRPLRGEQLPRTAPYELDLRPLGLAKGDRLKLVLEVVDDRGGTPGETASSEPLFLEISDESGVLAAILEADERSEQRLTEIIKRQLGIGEAP